MPESYPILSTSRSAAVGQEQVGSKEKFWLLHDGRMGLFKFARGGTGEHWAEQIAAGLAQLLDMPHAEYSLAVCDGQPGVVSWSFLEEGEDRSESLILGNEILAGLMTDYPRADAAGHYQRSNHHSLELVLPTCDLAEAPLRWQAPPGIARGSDVMVGYLLLDALICNTDRHDENWGWVRSRTGRMHMAATFDHASSLGRNEPDHKRRERLVTRDSGANVEAYCSRARSGLYASGATKPLTTFEAFRDAAAMRPEAAGVWANALRKVAPEAMNEVVERVPSECMSNQAKDFARAMLKVTRQRILEVVP